MEEAEEAEAAEEEAEAPLNLPLPNQQLPMETESWNFMTVCLGLLFFLYLFPLSPPPFTVL